MPASWAGLTPQHYEFDARVIRGHVSKRGSRMLRWALIETIQRQPAGTRARQVKDAIITRRGDEARSIAKTPPRHSGSDSLTSCLPGLAVSSDGIALGLITAGQTDIGV